MSWPTLENCRIAWRLITRILGAGSCGGGGAGVPAASAAVADRAKKLASNTVFFIILESCCGREVNDLGSIILGFDIGHRHIDLDRTEGRTPLKADAPGGAEGQI